MWYWCSWQALLYAAVLVKVMLLFLFGMTSDIGGGNGFGSCKHDRLWEMPQCYCFYLGWRVVLDVVMVLVLVGMTGCVGGSNVIGFSRDDEWRLLLHRIYSRGAAASFCICPHLGQIIFIIWSSCLIWVRSSLIIAYGSDHLQPSHDDQRSFGDYEHSCDHQSLSEFCWQLFCVLLLFERRKGRRRRRLEKNWMMSCIYHSGCHSYKRNRRRRSGYLFINVY